MATYRCSISVLGPLGSIELCLYSMGHILTRPAACLGTTVASVPLAELVGLAATRVELQGLAGIVKNEAWVARGEFRRIAVAQITEKIGFDSHPISRGKEFLINHRIIES